MEFVQLIEEEFARNANVDNAQWQNEYMRNKFEHLGIKTPVRREISKPFLQKEYLPSKKEAFEIARELYSKKYREYHHFALDLVRKYAKKLEQGDITFLEFLILNNSWWDTVDVVGPKLVWEYFKKFPQERDQYIDKWLASNNIWLQRTCLLFQLLSKKEMDTQCLSKVILSLNHLDEFFIAKAIGWVLRQYSRTDSQWVLDFVDNHPLKELSYKEAVRLVR